ncbi:hypothetical protein D3C72_363040 [compost metagenome]
MKVVKSIIVLSGLMLSNICFAQQPVKYEMTKIAEAVILPTLTPKEAYAKSLKEGRPDENQMFAVFYNRANKIANELSVRTDKQIAATNKAKKTGYKANNDDFAAMSTAEKAQYMRDNPEMQKTTGVSSSMMDLAAKMEDPAFKKKFDAMSDEQKAQLVMSYQQSSISLNQRTHTQKALKTSVEAGTLMGEFTSEYQTKAFTGFLVEKENKMQVLDEKEEKLLAPVLAEKSKLQRLVGANMSAAQSERLKQVTLKEYAIRNTTYEAKLKYHHDKVLELIAAYKRSALPVDNFFAGINYGAGLAAAKETAELAHLAGYQQGLLKAIVELQDVSKNITYESALFYEEKLKIEKSYQ